MTAGLLEQLRNYAEDFDAVVAPISLDEVTPPTPVRLRQVRRRRLPGWAYAAVAAVVVLAIGVSVLLLGLLVREIPPSDTTTTVTTTTLPTDTTTTTTVPETTTTTTTVRGSGAPAATIIGGAGEPRIDFWWGPIMADLPGEPGIVMIPASRRAFPPLWSFRPDTGWELSPSAEGLPKEVSGLGYDPTTELLWVSNDPDPLTPSIKEEFWTYAPRTGEWTRIDATFAPTFGGGRNDIAFAYFVGGAALDVQSRQLIYWSGPIRGGPYQTWAFHLDEHTWTEMNPGGPPGRTLAAMVYDAESDRVILFGGHHLTNEEEADFEVFGDTWAYDFDTDTWTNMDPPSAPPASSIGAMVYDPVTDRVILFGGATRAPMDPGATLDTTWAYDFNTNTWTQLQTASAPSSRAGAGMAHDPETGMIVLFGGGYYEWAESSDPTWLFDPVAETWTRWTSPDVAPIPQGDVPMDDFGGSD